MLPTCSKCGGATVNARVTGGGPVVLRPGKFVFMDVRYSELKAITCTKCGLTEFYAENPQKLIPR
jgi:predicted nucleic-acid-binding Zn-ribbon protein